MRTACQATRHAGFTLIELILVMTMLVIVLSVSAPSLSKFFRGRTLDSEAKRFLALTRYGQSRAVAEGFPMLLWVDPQEKRYGLQADSSYLPRDDKSLEYKLNADLEIQMEQSVSLPKRLGTIWKGTGGLPPKTARIKFNPDGFISDTSPTLIILHGRDEGQITLGESLNGMGYEIQTNANQSFRR